MVVHQVWNSLRFRIISMFILIIVALFAFLTYTNFESMNVVRKQVTRSYDDVLLIYTNQTEQLTDEVSSSLLNFLYNNHYLSLLHLYPYDGTDYNITLQAIQDGLKKNFSNYDIVDMYFIYDEKNNSLTIRGRGSTYVAGYADKFDYITSHIQELKDIESKTDPREWYITNVAGYMSMVKVYSNNQGICMGMLIDIGNIVMPLDKIDPDGNGYILAVGDGLIWSQSNGPSAAIVQKAVEKSKLPDTGNTPQTIQVGKSRFLMVKRQLDIASMNIVTLIPEKSLLKNLLLFQRIIYWLPVLAIVTLSLYLLSMQQFLFGPIGNLVSTMRQSTRKDLPVKMKEKGANEFIFIAREFNEMMQEIWHLKIDIYEEKIKTQQAEFRHLQAQINPHFYANSLNTICNLAADGKNESVQKMSQHMAAYYRYITYIGTSLVSLKSEMDHIVNYLEIQKFRFTDNLSFCVTLDKELQNFMILPLVVQTFVENAVIHGFNEWNEPLHIEIAATQENPEEGTACRIEIMDNGRGFSNEMLAKLQSENYILQNSEEHIGIWNCCKRLKLHYGDGVEISFSNRPTGGAKVSILIREKVMETGGGKEHV